MSPIAYTVKPGDTLSAIAAQFGFTTDTLADANDIRDQNIIYIGQVLTIPETRASTKNVTIQTTEEAVRLRSSAEFNDDNVVRYLARHSIFHKAQLNGDWWKLTGGYVHNSVVEIITDGNGVEPVPYRSQWDVDANNRNDDCGQTCVAMLAGWRGVNVRINDLPYQSTPAGDTSAENLVSNFAFNRVNLQAHRVDLPVNVSAPLNAICLVWYGGFERDNVQDRAFRGWHWVVLLEEHNDHVVVHDPDFWSPRREEGACKRYSRAEWNAAFIPYAGNAKTCVVLD
jgi:murein DD-endopeptidase MepM/ murein hydrolase activator NlpD